MSPCQAEGPTQSEPNAGPLAAATIVDGTERMWRRNEYRPETKTLGRHPAWASKRNDKALRQ